MGSPRQFSICANIVDESGNMDIGYILPNKIGRKLTGTGIILNGEKGIGV